MSIRTMVENKFQAKVKDGEGKWRLRFKIGKGENTYHRNNEKAHVKNAKTNRWNRGWKNVGLLSGCKFAFGTTLV